MDKDVKHTHVESIKQDKKWNLYHANLHSNATAYFKTAKELEIYKSSDFTVQLSKEFLYSLTLCVCYNSHYSKYYSLT